MTTYRIYSYHCADTMERYLVLVQKEYLQRVLDAAACFMKSAESIPGIRIRNAVIVVPHETGEVRYATAYDRYLHLNGLSRLLSEDVIYQLQTTDIAVDVDIDVQQLDEIVSSATDTVTHNPGVVISDRIYFELNGTNSHTILVPLDIQPYQRDK